MIRYQLDIRPGPAAKKVNYKDSLIFMGSCFSEHIAGNLSNLGFHISAQPSGIVFSPVSLAKPLLMMQKGEMYSFSDLIEQDLWHSKFHHGSFSGTSLDQVLDGLNDAHKAFTEAVQEAKFLFVTFGSAWVYRLIESGEIVANCHKLPQSRFSKELLDVGEIVQIWEQVLNYLRKINPGLRVIFTVSPVKHLRDGAVENTISKSILLVAIHELKKKRDIEYFPAYELVGEDLRDYRFYEQDAAHPNAMAIRYVSGKFNETYMDARTLEYISDMEKVMQLKTHKSIRQEGVEYEKFQQRVSTLKNEIRQKYHVDL